MENFDPDDPVTMYLRELENVQPLTRAEEKELFRNLREADTSDDRRENVARRIIETHLLLVVRAAERHSSTGISKLDLVQEGNIALMQAVQSFAERPVGTFSKYATTLIEEAVEKLAANRKQGQ